MEQDKLNYPIYKTERVNRTQTMRFGGPLFTGDAPRKGKRIPLKTIKYDEQRDGEAGVWALASTR